MTGVQGTPNPNSGERDFDGRLRDSGNDDSCSDDSSRRNPEIDESGGSDEPGDVRLESSQSGDAASMASEADLVEQYFLYPAGAQVDQYDSTGAFMCRKLAQRYCNSLATFFERNGPELSTGFASRIVDLARDYARNPAEHGAAFKTAEVGIPYAQLYALLQSPEIARMPVALEVLEALADLRSNEPWCFDMYSECADMDFKRLLRAGFNHEHIAAFQNFIDSDRLWSGSSSEMKRVFFSMVAEALEILARDHPLDTLPGRLNLIERGTQIKWGGFPAEIKYHLVYSFKSDAEQVRLAEFAQSHASFPSGRFAQKILDGEFDGAVWAI